MTYEEAKNLKSFQNHCNCGGFACAMNGRNAAQPHMTWCPQYHEYATWHAALYGQSKGKGSE